MQGIKATDIFPDNKSTVIPGEYNDKAAKGASSEFSKKVSENIPLREIAIEQSFYMQKDIKTAAEELEARLSSGQEGLAGKNAMVLAASGMTSQDFSRMKEDGFSPEDLDEKGMVTVADKIRVALAKGGMDISMMGDVSRAALDELSGNEVGKQAIKNALDKASEITEINDDTKRFLIKNDLEPTIENVHRANFSVSAKYEYSLKDAGVANLSEEDLKALMPQMEEVIRNAGLAVNEENLEGAKWLVSSKLPLTEESIVLYNKLTLGELKSTKEEVFQSIFDACSEGKEPEEAFVISGLSAREVALSAEKTLKEISDSQIVNAVKNNDPITLSSLSSQSDAPSNLTFEQGSKEEYALISARRSLEEVRLSMTYEASISMTIRGINVNTKPLSELVEELKAREAALYESLFGVKAESPEYKNYVSVYEETNASLEILKSSPAALAGFSTVTTISLRSLTVEATTVSAKFKAAGDSYEALMTAPRKDLGDSIKKAFRNVGDILEDLGFERSESNERAVRILGYNSLAITRESITEVRAADEQLQRLFKNLTPGVVTKMIREGENPLDLTLEELNEKAEEIKIKTEVSSEDESFAEFLFKMDRQKGLSEEERNSFVGIYRLMHQVIKGEGAVIGALLNQGADITMRNMMMAQRSMCHRNRETVIDDGFKGTASFKRESLSITNQIEMAFQTARLKDAKDAITPSKLASFEDERDYLDVTPDRLATILEKMPEDPEDDKAYAGEVLERTREAAQAEERVYEELRRFDQPATPAALKAMESFLSDRNGVFRKVFSNTVTEEDLEKTPKELMEDIMRRFGEAVKTPEDMAKAQETLARTAENVMKQMLVEQETGHIDIRGMRIALKQVQMLGEIGQQRENYTIPITVADENGTLNLKIVRGTSSENGLVEIAFNMDATGPVSASFKASAQGVAGSISCVKSAIEDFLKEQSGTIEEAIAKIAEQNVSVTVNHRESLSDEELYGEPQTDFEAGQERFAVQTRTLYSIAKTFIDILGQIGK